MSPGAWAGWTGGRSRRIGGGAEPKAQNSRKLHHLALQLGIPLQNRHRAYDDAYATARILVELLQRLRQQRITTVGELKLFESSLVAADGAAGGNGKGASGTAPA